MDETELSIHNVYYHENVLNHPYIFIKMDPLLRWTYLGNMSKVLMQLYIEDSDACYKDETDFCQNVFKTPEEYTIGDFL